MAKVIATDEEPDIRKDWMPTFLFCTSKLKFFFFLNIFIEMQIICNIELVSVVQQSDSATHTHILF